MMKGRRSRLKAWPALAICVIQVILFLAHWLVFSTWIAFWPGLAPAAVAGLHAAMLVLAFSFVAASLLSFRFSNVAVRFVYWLAAVWLGFLNFFFWASFLAWMAWFALRLTLSPAHPAAVRPLLAGVLYAIAALAGLYGLINARILRIRRFAVQLPNLPASWRGRRAVLLERSAPRTHQWRALLPPPRGQSRGASSPTSFFFPAIFSTAPTATSTASSRRSPGSPRRSASTSPRATTRSSPIRRITSRPSRAPEFASSATNL